MVTMNMDKLPLRKIGMEGIEIDALLALVRAVARTGYRFTSITPLTHSYVNALPGREWARNHEEIGGVGALRDIFGWSRPFYKNSVPTEIFYLMKRANILISFGEGWRSAIRISSLGEQLYVHSPYPTVDEHSVFFGPDTYRYVHQIQRALAGRETAINRAADIGSGAGPGAITIAQRHPLAEVFALDINPSALELTAANATLAGTTNVIPLYSDLLAGTPGKFDLITANPPYLVDAEQRAYRHGGGALGADLSLAIIDAAIPRLSPGGTLLLYTGVAIVDGLDLFKAAAEERLIASGISQSLAFNYFEIDPDIFGEELLNPCYADADRIAAVLLEITLGN